MDCVQLFTKNNNQWRAKEITDDDVARFRGALTELGIGHPTVIAPTRESSHDWIRVSIS